ncbi:hypothetical protein [Lysinibacillus sp. NPDC092081]
MLKQNGRGNPGENCGALNEGVSVPGYSPNQSESLITVSAIVICCC